MTTDREKSKDLIRKSVQRINVRYAFLEGQKLKEGKQELNRVTYSSPNPEILSDLLELIPTGSIEGEIISFDLPEFGEKTI